ncbi:polyprenyl synthetase family protein [Peribacillus sp. SCS-155]|uniref:polyprenyl synthetase family protein n=1 Tax=Peribacillus sedimenti TaxID=3115297 RepID=UPI00390654C6
MANAAFTSFSRQQKAILEEELIKFVKNLQAPAVLKNAMAYSLSAGGKRIRPLLLLAVLKCFGKEPGIGIPAAVAIEMIHTYSLIHDDLPSMDDDDLRRGKPTNHKIFGEANAILAGDALLTYSFQIIAQINDLRVSPEMKLEIIAELAKASGAEGMVGGQVADLEGEDKQLTLSELEYVHEHKTGKLLSASVLSGAILSGACERQKSRLNEFSYHLGLAFQIRDDILDIEGTEELIGKPVGSDTGNNKSTYPSLLTLEGAKLKLMEHIQGAHQQLDQLEINTGLLKEITDLIAVRDH